MKIKLQDLMPQDWGAEQPANFTELVNTDYESLNEQARGVRALLIEAIHGFERTPVSTAAECREQIEKRFLPTRRNRWNLVALNNLRERIYVNKNTTSGSGGLRLLVDSPKYGFPTITSAATNAPLPFKGVYLPIFGGGPDILADKETYKSFVKFANKFPVADVILWDEKDESAIFWSVASQIGINGSTELEFPDLEVFTKWRKLLCTS